MKDYQFRLLMGWVLAIAAQVHDNLPLVAILAFLSVVYFVGALVALFVEGRK